MSEVVGKRITGTIAGIFTLLLTGCGGASSGDGVTGSGDQAASTGHDATLSWTAPATRINGEGLVMAELQGYVITYGQSPDALTRQVEVNGSDTMEYTIRNLDRGDWYFAVQVVDQDGLASAPSAVVSKQI